MDDVADQYPPAAVAAAAGASRSSSPSFRIIVYCILATIVIYVGTALALFMPALDYGPKPRLFIRLVKAQGLDPCVAEVRSSPIFELAVDVDRVSESTRGPCVGGGEEGALLRVSYRGIILAWGSVPRFCIDGRSLQGSSSSASVACVVATAEGSVLREEMRNMIRAETQAFGSAEFDVEGYLPGLGHLRCRTYLFQGEQTETLPATPCYFQKKSREGAW